jgi:hemoglobin-like flavoprotein
LGLLAWHAIVGKAPRVHDGVDDFPKEQLPTFLDHLPSPNTHGLHCSPWLAELVMTMTAKEPMRRLTSLDEVIKRLTAAPAEELGLVRVSYERCLQSEGGADAFFGRVYGQLKELLPEGEWTKFGATVDWHMQRANLAEAIALLLAFYAIDSPNREPTALSRIGRKHGRTGYMVSPESFPLFQRALVDTVIETLAPSSPEEREGLVAAWGKVLRPGIDYLSRQAGGSRGSDHGWR